MKALDKMTKAKLAKAAGISKGRISQMIVMADSDRPPSCLSQRSLKFIFLAWLLLTSPRRHQRIPVTETVMQRLSPAFVLRFLSAGSLSRIETTT